MKPNPAKDQLKGTDQKGAVVVHSQQWSGPLPPPAVLEQYNAVHPGLAERIVSSMEIEQQHRHSMERQLLETHRRVYTRGQYFAATVALVSLGAALVLGLYGQGTAAIAFVTVGLGQTVLAFLGQRGSDKEGD